eukprot:PITA_11683
MPLSAADPGTAVVWFGCEKPEYRNGSSFQRNLNQVLNSLVGNVSTSGFNVSSVVVVEGQNSNSSVYGLLQCRRDLNSSDCRQCASTAKTNLVQRCHNTSGLIQLDGCFLRYDNHNFYGHIDSTPKNLICNGGKSSKPREFTDAVDALLSNVTKKAAQSPQLFFADYSLPSNLMVYVYAIAQCWKDLSQKDCGSCLTSASSSLVSCGTGTIGAQFASKNCYLRFEMYSFFNLSVLPQHPPPTPPPTTAAPSEGKKCYILLGITLGAVAAMIGLIAAIGGCKWNFFALRERFSRSKCAEIGEEGALMLNPNIAASEFNFKYDILREATSNFKPENKLAEGGFGSIFKGVLPGGREIAVKRLYMSPRLGDAEFVNEANLMSRVEYKNLVKLLGCSVGGSERLLVYEYLPNRSLDEILFDTTRRHLLDWKKRFEIIVGIARGLTYLHEEPDIKIIHRNIKASNILLDEDYRAKITDFGLAKLFAEDLSRLTTTFIGTVGYMAPEYALRGQLTEKADVFSFGVLLLEIISGRKSQSLAPDAEFLIEETWKLYKADRGLEAMDATLEGSYSVEEAIKVIKIGLLCTQAAAALRPSMSRVVWMLTNEVEHDIPSPTKPVFIDLDCEGAHGEVKRPAPENPDETSRGRTETSAGTLEPR